MKKVLRGFVLFLFSVLLLCVPAAAYQTRSGNYAKPALTGDHAADIVKVAQEQWNKKKTKSQLGYTEHWCADFVLDCARIAGIPKSIIPYDTASCAACGAFYQKMKTMNARVVTASEAKAGDLVFYYCKSCKSYPHVGIYAGGGYFIEGNMWPGGVSKVLKYNTYYNHTTSSGKVHSTKDVVSRIYVRPNYIDYQIANAQTSLSKTSFTYNMLPQFPVVTVKANGKVLREGTDYTLKYSNNTNAGKASVKITGKGKYKGSKTLTYQINPINISGLKGMYVSDCTYTGKQLKPKVKCSLTSVVTKVLAKPENLKIAYGPNKNMGRGAVYVTGVKNLTGTKTLYFNICPKKVSGLSATIRAGRVTLKWNHIANVDGYEIAYRKAGSSAWTTKTSGSSATVLDLKRLTKYEIRVRAYIKLKSQKVYGSWSDVKSIKTKLL